VFDEIDYTSKSPPLPNIFIKINKFLKTLRNSAVKKFEPSRRETPRRKSNNKESVFICVHLWLKICNAKAREVTQSLFMEIRMIVIPIEQHANRGTFMRYRQDLSAIARDDNLFYIAKVGTSLFFFLVVLVLKFLQNINTCNPNF